MARTLTLSRSGGGAGISVSRQKTITGDNLISLEKSLSAAKTGTLTTRTDANTGTITGQSSHGVQTGDKICIFWDGGCRYNVTVGTVSGNSIPIDLGGGTDLPTANTTLTLMVQSNESSGWAFSGSNLVALFAAALVPFVVLFLNDGSAVLAAFYSDDTDGDAFFYDSTEAGNGALTNVLSGETVASVSVAHGSSAAAAIVTVAALVN